MPSLIRINQEMDGLSVCHNHMYIHRWINSHISIILDVSNFLKDWFGFSSLQRKSNVINFLLQQPSSWIFPFNGFPQIKGNVRCAPSDILHLSLSSKESNILQQSSNLLSFDTNRYNLLNPERVGKFPRACCNILFLCEREAIFLCRPN